eukprot:PhM_4_TR9137/c0_g1_i1/m.34589
MFLEVPCRFLRRLVVVVRLSFRVLLLHPGLVLQRLRHHVINIIIIISRSSVARRSGRFGPLKGGALGGPLRLLCLRVEVIKLVLVLIKHFLPVAVHTRLRRRGTGTGGSFFLDVWFCVGLFFRFLFIIISSSSGSGSLFVPLLLFGGGILLLLFLSLFFSRLLCRLPFSLESGLFRTSSGRCLVTFFFFERCRCGGLGFGLRPCLPLHTLGVHLAKLRRLLLGLSRCLAALLLRSCLRLPQLGGHTLRVVHSTCLSIRFFPRRRHTGIVRHGRRLRLLFKCLLLGFDRTELRLAHFPALFLAALLLLQLLAEGRLLLGAAAADLLQLRPLLHTLRFKAALGLLARRVLVVDGAADAFEQGLALGPLLLEVLAALLLLPEVLRCDLLLHRLVHARALGLAVVVAAADVVMIVGGRSCW